MYKHNRVTEHVEKEIEKLGEGSAGTGAVSSLRAVYGQSQFSFSTHAGHSEIVKFAEECQAETVVVYHTDPNHARPLLVEDLESRGHTVHTPINGESTIIS